MNEQLRQLMLEAGYAAPELAGRANKFAELIVRECAKACEKNSYLALNGWQRAKQIKEHFGVEE
jgi:hypothetical protein